MAGSLTPIFRWSITVDGAPSPGALLYTYTSGTTTPAAVYNNADLAIGHRHTNPVVADANGVFPVIYLADQAYRFFVTDANGATIYPAQDDIYDFGQLYQPTQAIGTVEGRLTLTSGVPVTKDDVSAATSVYFTPYEGNRIALYTSAGAWAMFTFAELSVGLAGATASRPYDVFAAASGTAVTLEKATWSSATARFGSGVYATLLPTQDGVYVKSTNGTTVDATRRYLGTVYINASGGQTDDTYAKRYLWNKYHQKSRPMRVLEATDSWTYDGVLRQANGSAANQIDLVVGVAEVELDAEVVAIASSNTAGRTLVVGIGEDSTTVIQSSTLGRILVAQVTAAPLQIGASLRLAPAVGRHYYAWLESANASTITWYGDSGGTSYQSGISGSIQG